MKLSQLAFFAVVCCTASVFSSCDQNKAGIAANGKAEFSDSAVSSVRVYQDAQGRKVILKNNTNYDIVDFTDKQDQKKLLLKITKSENAFVDSATSQNHFIISVSSIGAGQVHWTKEFSGTDLDYTNKVLVIHTEGKTSDQEDTYTQYSLQTGAKLMTYTYAQLMALIPNTSNKRFFGYLSGLSATEDRPSQFATISYVGSNEAIDQVNIKIKKGNVLPPYTPELNILAAQESGNTVANEGRTVILSHATRAYQDSDITNFAMQVSYNMPDGKPSLVVLLPVRGDRIDLDNATYDKNIFEIEKAK